MRYRVIVPLVAAAAVGLAAPALGGAGRGRASTSDAAHPLTTQRLGDPAPSLVAPYLTFSTTKFRGSAITISTAGNIIQFTSPNSPGAQYEHLATGARSEGYVLCYDPTPAPGSAPKAYDTGDAAAGFGPPVDDGTTITRTTVDGKVRFTQTFTFDDQPGATGLTVKMDVTNLTTVPLTGVILRRQVDFDIDTGGSSGWAGFVSTHARTRAAVMAFHDPSDAPPGKEAHGIMLHTVRSVLGAATSTVTRTILDHTCTPASAPLDPVFKVARGDYGESMSYPMHLVEPRDSESVTVGYLRY